MFIIRNKSDVDVKVFDPRGSRIIEFKARTEQKVRSINRGLQVSLQSYKRFGIEVEEVPEKTKVPLKEGLRRAPKAKVVAKVEEDPVKEGSSEEDKEDKDEG